MDAIGTKREVTSRKKQRFADNRLVDQHVKLGSSALPQSRRPSRRRS